MILFNPFSQFILVMLFFYITRLLLFKTGLIHTVKKYYKTIQDHFYVHQFFIVPELHEEHMLQNPLYNKISLYLHSLPSIEDSDFINLISEKKTNDIILTLNPSNQVIEDNFLGAKISWINERDENSETNRFLLKIRKSDKRRILRPYLNHIIAIAEEIDDRANRDLKLFTITENRKNQLRWKSVPFIHPSTFDTMSMDEGLKQKVRSDLESFMKAEAYYNRIGRTWKRSFLLYGPSGTGKSTFIAAMANFLKFDIYDMDLNKIKTNYSSLKSLLLQTSRRSIIVIEHLDRYIAQKCAYNTGIMDFMDGILTGCCTDEVVMVFTMNNKDGVDGDLMRPGRVDVHIEFSLCDFAAFKDLAGNYLGLKEHKLFGDVEEMFEKGASLSAAEIGELMIANRNSPSRAIKSVIGALRTDGDGRGGRIGRWIGGESKNKEGSAVQVIEEPDGVFCGGDVKKLYGFFRLKNNNRKSQPLLLRQ